MLCGPGKQVKGVGQVSGPRIQLKGLGQDACCTWEQDSLTIESTSRTGDLVTPDSKPGEVSMTSFQLRAGIELNLLIRKTQASLIDSRP